LSLVLNATEFYTNKVEEWYVRHN